MGFDRKVMCLAMVFLSVGFQAFAQDDHTGWLQVIWGDNHVEDAPATHQVFLLTKESGETLRLNMDLNLLAPFGGVGAVNGKRITISASKRNDAAQDEYEVSAVWVGEDMAERGIAGSKPWISILLKFSDIAAEPENLAFFSGMYGNVPGQLDHYWREVSSNNINVVGSVAVDWMDMPQPQTFYIPTPGSGSNANLTALFNDAIATLDPFVDFSNGGTGGYEGINIMFNGLLDCCAWGGTRFASIDGVSKVWRVTWDPPWAYADEAVIAHEMGHGFGLPHCNNSDGDSNPYDNPWDVMSAATSYSVSDGTYGRLGKHVNAYHKDRLGWIPADEKAEVLDTSMTLTLDHLALESTANFRMVTLPIGGSSSHYYTIETRDLFGNYDGNLVGNAVLIYEVLTSRSEPAWLVDGDPTPATFSDNEGVMWRVGETFNDAANNISITVDSATADGFVISVSNNDAGCSYAINPSAASYDETGGSDAIAVTTGAGCAWTAVSNDGWITITGGATGSGSGTISYSVAANGSLSSREGTITAAGHTFTVNQAGETCAYAIDPGSAGFNPTGGNSTFAVTAQSGCAWTAVSNTGWITVTGGATGDGNGSVSYSVAANTGVARNGSISAAGLTFNISQSGLTCSYAISPGSAGFIASGGNSTVAVTVQTLCVWTAVSNDAWITVTGGAAGSGNGTVSYSVAANTGPARNGTITMAGNTFNVSQNGTACTYAINPEFKGFPFSGGNDAVAVTAQSGCDWTAVSNDPWVTVTDGATGSGNGTVSYSVAANTGSARIATITIAGETFQVNQARLICTYAMSPSSAAMNASGGSSSLGVSAANGCDWTAVSNNSWITVTSGTSGNGNGTVSYTVDPNISTGRLGTITIAGEFFVINQAAACILAPAFLAALPEWPAEQSVLSLVPLSGCN